MSVDKSSSTYEAVIFFTIRLQIFGFIIIIYLL